jgi:hypothetical protein
MRKVRNLPLFTAKTQQKRYKNENYSKLTQFNRIITKKCIFRKNVTKIVRNTNSPYILSVAKYCTFSSENRKFHPEKAHLRRISSQKGQCFTLKNEKK